jgi:glycine oxidase
VWATAHWRNGILLAPITADAVANVLGGGGLPEIFETLMPARFAPRALALEEGEAAR